ncbi:TrkA C-terminal domain-containing protein, partial [Akkermansia sp.]
MFDILLNHNTLVLFGIIFFGIALGSIKIYGLNLGLSGVLFVALAAGHYRLAIPNGVGQLGLALFVYCVGLSAGNRFFSAIAKQGSKLAVMSAVIVGVSALFTCLFGIWFNVPAGISSGIFAGACTSTPALAAATESLPGASGSGVSIGYGIAYPFGVVGVVLFVQLLPRLLHFDLNKEAKAMHSRQEASIISRLVRVTQPNLVGQNIADCKLLDGLHCMVTRVVRNDRLMPLTPEDTFREGTEVLIVGNSDTMPHDIAFLGEICDNPYPMDSQKERRKLILTNKSYAGRKLRELKTLRTDGVIISRISRLGFTFVPTGDTTLERNDVLTVVGSPENLTKYGDKIGHRSQDMNQTDLLSLGFGLSLGIILGLVNFSLGNG